MNRLASMLPRKSLIVLTVLCLTLTCLIVRQRKLAAEKLGLEAAQTKLLATEQTLLDATVTRDSVRQELAQERKTLLDRRVALAKAEKELAQAAPDAVWAEPPANWPEWIDASPYIWIRKTSLAKLPGSPLTDEAELREEVAAVLAIDPATREALNAKLSAVITEYRALEAEHAERVQEPLLGIANDGPQMTLRILPFPEEAERLKSDFQRSMRETLGQSRAELILESAQGWLNSQFAAAGQEPRTISVVRHPNGTYNLSSKGGGSWRSVGGFTRLGDFLPQHLVRFFSEGLGQ